MVLHTVQNEEPFLFLCWATETDINLVRRKISPLLLRCFKNFNEMRDSLAVLYARLSDEITINFGVRDTMANERLYFAQSANGKAQEDRR